MSAGSGFALVVVLLALALVGATCVAYSPTDHDPERGRGDMADENILAGMTGEQADEDIARREAKVEQLEATLRVAKDNLKAARTERKRLDDPASSDAGGVTAEAGAAEASGEVRG